MLMIGPGGVETGEFGAVMDVKLVNQGPVTILLERLKGTASAVSMMGSFWHPNFPPAIGCSSPAWTRSQCTVPGIDESLKEGESPEAYVGKSRTL
ncbi:MAG: hypothetical protein Ct9H300mP15_18440 [Gemmatimonadota bacterium]|nr:MAG: hypothetical protein Ct9H300mP15_18440 [Gemmatimonadota bacterium]